jgi:hypothetical protein
MFPHASKARAAITGRAALKARGLDEGSNNTAWERKRRQRLVLPLDQLPPDGGPRQDRHRPIVPHGAGDAQAVEQVTADYTTG